MVERFIWVDHLPRMSQTWSEFKVYGEKGTVGRWRDRTMISSFLHWSFGQLLFIETLLLQKVHPVRFRIPMSVRIRARKVYYVRWCSTKLDPFLNHPYDLGDYLVPSFIPELYCHRYRPQRIIVDSDLET